MVLALAPVCCSLEDGANGSRNPAQTGDADVEEYRTKGDEINASGKNKDDFTQVCGLDWMIQLL